MTVILQEPSITWAEGNLIYDATTGGCKIGAKTDGGLYFQCGSLVGWSTTGSPAITVKPANLLPANEAWTAPGKIWQGATGTVPFTVKNSGTADEQAGVGDPCRYYLGGAWRMPTKDEYVELFKNSGYPSTGPWTWNTTSKSATHTGGLILLASGYRNPQDGTLAFPGRFGSYWSASPSDVVNGNSMVVSATEVMLDRADSRTMGTPVRCVRD